MEKIKLTELQKKMLERLSLGNIVDDIPAEMDALRFLKNKGLVDYIEMDQSMFAGVELTDKGKIYIQQNPKLQNPRISLKFICKEYKFLIGTLLTILGIIIAYLTLIK